MLACHIVDNDVHYLNRNYVEDIASIAGFLTNVVARCPAGTIVRVTGDEHNAALIESLHRCSNVRVQIHPPVRARVCSPVTILSQLIVLPDIYAQNWFYATDSYIQDSLLLVDAATAKTHPLVAALNFFACIDTDNLVTCLRAIGDVRWFKHPCRPSRHSKLFSFFGNKPASLRDVSKRLAEKQPPSRFDYLTRVWFNPRAASYYGGRTSHEAEDYFWRQFRTNRRDVTTGIINTNRKLLTLITYLWLARVNNHREYSFDALRFFNDEPTATAFITHWHKVIKHPR